LATAGRAGLALVILAMVGWFVFGVTDPVDLAVYRAGVVVWWHGGDLYGPLPGTSLPFIYPPFSVVLLVPFTLSPYSAGVLTIAALVLVIVLVLRSLEVRPNAVLVGAVLVGALVLEPVRETLYFGQINVLLMALVTTDCLVRDPKWPRGLLVGVAAAIKLTPLVFVLFFLLRGDRRAAITVGLSFLGATAVGFLLSWQNSLRFWTEQVVFGTQSRGMSNPINQSLKVMLVRLGSDQGLPWLLLAVVVLAMTAVGIRRAQHPTWALGLNALGGLLISPVSYSHHWVWAVPVLLTAAVTAWRTRARSAIVATVVGMALFVLAPHWWWDADDPWTVLHLLVGNAYVIAAVLVLGQEAVEAAGSGRKTSVSE
jgi:alpha-1,2-mannosyltransferase